jgi:cobalt/nickel transport system permease protein
MAVVFIVQAVFFQDGGLTVLGANTVNMGLIGTFGGYYLYWGIRKAIGRDTPKGILVGTAVAAWISVFVASLLCAVQLGLSGTVPMNVALAAMAFWHFMIAIGEAVITVIAISFVFRTRPDLIYKPPRQLAASARPMLPR